MTESTPQDDQQVDDDVIRGKVVGFVNKRELIMNVGKAHGVQIGMQFVVLVPGGAEVEYEDGEEIFTTTVEVPKTIVKVVRFSGENASIGRTFMTIKGRPAQTVRNPRYMFGTSALDIGFGATEPEIHYPAVPDRVETFDVDDTISNEVDLTPRKGDEVRSTTGDEFVFPGG